MPAHLNYHPEIVLPSKSLGNIEKLEDGHWEAGGKPLAYPKLTLQFLFLYSKSFRLVKLE